jgi:hypothetical protein
MTQISPMGDVWSVSHRTRQGIALLLLVIISACRKPNDVPRNSFDDDQVVLRSTPITDLQFNDVMLQEIATQLVREARSRGINEISGQNRIDCLLRLEASLGRSHLALDRVNELVSHLIANDAGPWAKIRQRGELQSNGRTEGARRVATLLARWRRRKADIAFEYLSSNYSRFISSAEWERRFHEFIAGEPLDVATWAWLLVQDDPQRVRQRYGRVSAELAFRNYLEVRGVGGANEARRMFSVPGIEITEEIATIPPRD